MGSETEFPKTGCQNREDGSWVLNLDPCLCLYCGVLLVFATPNRKKSAVRWFYSSPVLKNHGVPLAGIYRSCHSCSGICDPRRFRWNPSQRSVWSKGTPLKSHPTLGPWGVKHFKPMPLHRAHNSPVSFATTLASWIAWRWWKAYGHRTHYTYISHHFPVPKKLLKWSWNTFFQVGRWCLSCGCETLGSCLALLLPSGNQTWLAGEFPIMDVCDVRANPAEFTIWFDDLPRYKDPFLGNFPATLWGQRRVRGQLQP